VECFLIHDDLVSSKLPTMDKLVVFRRGDVIVGENELDAEMAEGELELE
jgi:hypothetical protein